MLMSCAIAGSASDPAAISAATKEKLYAGRSAALTKASSDGPARTPSRLRDSRSRSSATASGGGIGLRCAGRRGAAAVRAQPAARHRSRAGPAQGGFQPLRHLGEILVGAGLGAGGGGGGAAARRRARRAAGRRRHRGGALRRLGAAAARGIVGSLREVARDGIGSGRSGGAGLGPAAERLRREAGQRIACARRVRTAAAPGGATSSAKEGADRRAAAARALRFGVVELGSDRPARFSPSLQPARAAARSGRLLGDRRHAARICRACGMARTMFCSTTMSVGPPIIRRCSTLSRRTSTSRRRPSTAAASITASRGIRPRLRVGAEAVAGEAANQPGGEADQRQNDDECEEECQWSATSLVPGNRRFRSSVRSLRRAVRPDRSFGRRIARDQPYVLIPHGKTCRPVLNKPRIA